MTEIGTGWNGSVRTCSAASCTLSNVTGADVATSGTSLRALFDGSLRSRLRVRTVGGGEVFFVVNRVEEWVLAVTAATER